MHYFKKRELQAMMYWEPDMPMDLVSISKADKNNGSPKDGDWIAVNPKDATDMWLVAKEFVKENYVFSHESR